MPIKDVNDQLSEPLWNNPRVSKTQLFLSDWYNNSIVLITDLMYGNGDYISHKDLKMVYQFKTNFLEYHRVITYVNIYLGKLKMLLKYT